MSSFKRVDNNQKVVVQAIKRIGADWLETSADPRCGCDGIVLYKGSAYVAEIKNGSLPPSRQKLTPNELKTQTRCSWRGVPYLILTSPEQAIETLLAIKEVKPK